MRDIPIKDQIPQTRDGLLIYIKSFKRDLKTRQDHLDDCEKRLETIEIELGIRKAFPSII